MTIKYYISISFSFRDKKGLANGSVEYFKINFAKSYFLKYFHI